MDDPVSVFETSAVIITQAVEGGRPTDADGRSDDPAVLAELGGLLGRLHALPASGGAIARDGGAEEADGGFYVGRPSRDLAAAAMGFLATGEVVVPDAGREKFDWLRAQVETADDAEGLPEALTHSNFHLWSAVGVPGGLTIVGWAGSGRGPRLPALAWLLRTAAQGGPHLVDAVLRGYREHVQLTEDELDRLPGILNLRPLWLACLELRMTLEVGDAPTLEGGWMNPRSAEYAERLAAQVVPALRRCVLRVVAGSESSLTDLARSPDATVCPGRVGRTRGEPTPRRARCRGTSAPSAPWRTSAIFRRGAPARSARAHRA